MTIEWIAAHSVGAAPASFDLDKYVNVTAGSALYGRLGIAEPFRVPSKRLLPTQALHSLVTSRVDGVAGSRARLPYPSVYLAPGFVGSITSIKAYLFSEHVLVTRIKAVVELPIDGKIGTSISSISALRSAKELPVVRELMWAIAKAVQGKPRSQQPGPSFKQYFGMQLKLPWPVEQFESNLNPLRARFVALLIGAPVADRLQTQLIEAVEQSSEELNVKASGESLLMNRQGLIYLLPSATYTGPHQDRFDRTLDLATLAVFARTFLSEGHGLRSIDAQRTDDTVRRIGQWARRPETTFDASVTQTVTWSVLARELLLPERYLAWKEYFS